MSTHTPGPWEFDLVTLEVSALVDPDNSPNYYAPICKLDDEWAADFTEANARLIASAPDLLAALTAIESHWSAGNFSRTDELWSQMRAAIRKATGE